MRRIGLWRLQTVGLLATVVFCSVSGAQTQPTTAEKPLGQKPRAIVVPDRLILEKDVEYGRAGDLPLLLDMLRPKEPKSSALPMVVFIHGGAWRTGSKSAALGPLIPYAMSGNYVCASVEYRFSSVAPWPAQIHDCKAAIRFLKANAAKYGIDPDKIGVWGSSAGGHLVSLLGVTADEKKLEGTNGSPGQTSRVACVVDYCGPSDFIAIMKLKGTPEGGVYSPVSGLLGGPIEQRQELAKEASPITYASKNAAPILIVQGTADKAIPVEQSESFHAALKQAGADSTLIKILGGGHDIGGPEISGRVLTFFEKHLRGMDGEVSDTPIQVSTPAIPN